MSNNNNNNNNPNSNNNSPTQSIIKTPLTEAIEHVDDFIRQLHSTPLPGIIKEIAATHEEIDTHTLDQAQSLKESLGHYSALLKQEREAANNAAAQGATADDVILARKEVIDEENKKERKKAYRDQEKREVDAMQHQINAITAGINEEVGEDGEEVVVFDEELAQLEEELSTLQAKLDIYQKLSHITFLPDTQPMTNQSHNNNNNSRGISHNVVNGYATLNNLGDIRPFEIDLEATPANSPKTLRQTPTHKRHHKGLKSPKPRQSTPTLTNTSSNQHLKRQHCLFFSTSRSHQTHSSQRSTFITRTGKPQIYLPDDFDPIDHPHQLNNKYHTPLTLRRSYPLSFNSPNSSQSLSNHQSKSKQSLSNQRMNSNNQITDNNDQNVIPTPYQPKIVPSSALQGRIGVVADVQFANVPNAWNFAKTNERAYYRALGILSSANDIFNYINMSQGPSQQKSQQDPSTNNTQDNNITQSHPNKSSHPLYGNALPKLPCRPVNPGVIFRDESVSLIDMETSHHGICIRPYDSPSEQSHLTNIFYPHNNNNNDDDYHGNSGDLVNKNGVRIKVLNELDTYTFPQGTPNGQIDHVIQLGDFIDGKNASLPISGIENQDVEQLSIQDLIQQHHNRSVKNFIKVARNNFVKKSPSVNTTGTTSATITTTSSDINDNLDNEDEFISFIPTQYKEGVPHQVVVKGIHKEMLSLHYYFILKFLQFASTQPEFIKLQAIPLVEQMAMRDGNITDNNSNVDTTQPMSPITPNSTTVSPLNTPIDKTSIISTTTTATTTTITTPTTTTTSSSSLLQINESSTLLPNFNELFTLGGPKIPLYYYLEQIRNRITPTTFHSFIRSTFPIFSNPRLTPNLSSLFASLLTEAPTMATATALGSVFNTISKSKQPYWHSLMGNHELYTISRPLLPYIYSTTGRLEDSIISKLIKKFNSQVDTILSLPIHQEHDGLKSITEGDIDSDKINLLKMWLKEEEDKIDIDIALFNKKIDLLFQKTQKQTSLKGIFDALMDHIDSEIDFVQPSLPELTLPEYITQGKDQISQSLPPFPTLDSNIALYNTISTHPTHPTHNVNHDNNDNQNDENITTIPTNHKHQQDSFYDPYNYTHCYHTSINDNYHLIVIDGYRGATSGYPLLHDHFQLPLVNHLAKNNHNLLIPPPSTQYPYDLLTNPPRGNWINGLTFEMKRFVPYNGALMAPQLDWLETILSSPTTIPLHKRVIITSHVAFSQYHATGTTVLYDGNELLELLRRYKQRVDLCLFGHDHSGHYMYDKTCGTHFVTPAAPIEASHGDVFHLQEEMSVNHDNNEDDDHDGCDPNKTTTSDNNNKNNTTPTKPTSPTNLTTNNTNTQTPIAPLQPPSQSLNDPNSNESQTLKLHKAQHRAQNVSYNRGYRKLSRKIAYNQDPNLVGLNNGTKDVFDGVVVDQNDNNQNRDIQSKDHHKERLYNNDFIHAAAVIELYQDEAQIIGFGNVVSRYIKFGSKKGLNDVITKNNPNPQTSPHKL